MSLYYTDKNSNSFHNIVMNKNATTDNTDFLSVPFCLFMGPQRSGTSWLYRYLSDRGDICLPHKVKETFFFDRYFRKGIKHYKSHFTILPDHKLAMEITTTSFAEPDVPQRIADSLGYNVRLVCPLRDPIVRSYSLYKHFKRYGMVKGSLEEAVEKMPEIIETSRYAYYLQNWIDVFGKENIHFSFQEHLSQNQEDYIKNICDAVGISYMPVKKELKGKYNATATPPSFWVASFAQKSATFLRSIGLYHVINIAKKLGVKKYIFGDANPDADPTQIPEEDRKFLEQHLSGEIEKLENLLGFKIQYWQK